MDLPNINFYTAIPPEYVKPLASYERYNEIKIELPCRAVVAGSSGTGKTLAVLNFINTMNSFNKFVLVIADINEPLYRFLIDFVTQKYGKKSITVYDNIADLPDVNSFDPKYNNLIVIDDQLNEKSKNHKNAIDCYIKGRRRNISIIYITQNFFGCDITIRKNSKVIILTRFDSADDLKNILMKYKGKLSMSAIQNLYHYAVDDNLENYFLIDNEGKDGYKFRKNLKGIC